MSTLEFVIWTVLIIGAAISALYVILTLGGI